MCTFAKYRQIIPLYLVNQFSDSLITHVGIYFDFHRTSFSFMRARLYIDKTCIVFQEFSRILQLHLITMERKVISLHSPRLTDRVTQIPILSLTRTCIYNEKSLCCAHKKVGSDARYVKGRSFDSFKYSALYPTPPRKYEYIYLVKIRHTMKWK